MVNSPAPGFTPAWPTVILRRASAAWPAPASMQEQKQAADELRGRFHRFLQRHVPANYFCGFHLSRRRSTDLSSLVQAGAQAGDDDDRHEHRRHLKTLRRHRAQIAESHGRAVLFGNDDIDQSAPESNAHAGDDIRQRAGQRHFEKNLAVFRAESARHGDQPDIGIRDADHGVDQDRKHGGEDRHDNFRNRAETEQHDDQRQQRDQRRGINARQQRIESFVDVFVPTHRHAENHAEYDRNDEADCEIRQAEPHVLPDGAVGEKLVAFDNNFAERRKIKGIENFEAGRTPPKPRKNATIPMTPSQSETSFAATLPPAIGRQRIRLVDRNEIDGILFLFRRSGAPWAKLRRTLFAAGCDCQGACCALQISNSRLHNCRIGKFENMQSGIRRNAPTTPNASSWRNRNSWSYRPESARSRALFSIRRRKPISETT